jgi:hypothetical protein
MSKHKFTEGDWCFYNAALANIITITNGTITSVLTTRVESGVSLENHCVPLTVENRQDSDFVKTWREKIGAVLPPSGNYSAISEYLADLWVELCETTEHRKRLALYQDINNFCTEVINIFEVVNNKTISGVKIFD